MLTETASLERLDLSSFPLTWEEKMILITPSAARPEEATHSTLNVQTPPHVWHAHSFLTHTYTRTHWNTSTLHTQVRGLPYGHGFKEKQGACPLYQLVWQRRTHAYKVYLVCRKGGGRLYHAPGEEETWRAGEAGKEEAASGPFQRTPGGYSFGRASGASRRRIIGHK